MNKLERNIYCPKCGAKLIKTKFLYDFCFDTESGRKIEYYHTKVKCPNNNLFSTHYNEEFDSSDNIIPNYSY